MAKNNFKSIYICAFLAIIILGHECVTYTEGRHLKEKVAFYKRCLEEEAGEKNNGEEMVEGSVEGDSAGNADGGVVTNDARPSVPGHSPGVGH
ncbi:hypothetical protein MA16_Dca015365 [Dendrobium catenatum]|uniref:Uncharacterized protein n=1 Tax=Dendrobium catenatum TaxID=906689 RepID=A0A2I0W1E3_9ASPA|nr:hypothetical protein MA16_Dca015365 [Dendrobium catenatum]